MRRRSAYELFLPFHKSDLSLPLGKYLEGEQSSSLLTLFATLRLDAASVIYSGDNEPRDR